MHNLSPRRSAPNPSLTTLVALTALTALTALLCTACQAPSGVLKVGPDRECLGPKPEPDRCAKRNPWSWRCDCNPVTGRWNCGGWEGCIDPDAVLWADKGSSGGSAADSGSHDAAVADGADTESPAAPWRSALFPASWKPGFTAFSGLGLEDYSYAGYHGGEVALPAEPPGDAIAVALPFGATAGTDSRALVQAALDQAAAAGGGVVRLAAGTYRIEGRLHMTASGVVLRGAALDASGHPTTQLWFPTHKGMNHLAHLQVGGPLKHGADVLLASDGARRSAVVHVKDASSFQVGDDVDVGWQITPAFIADHGMTGTWKAFNDTWQPFFRRAILAIDTSVTPHAITLDVPLRYPALLRDKASLRRVTGWIKEVGVAFIAISNAVDWDAAWSHNQVHAIGFQGVKDGWLQHVHSFAAPEAVQEKFLVSPHLQSGGIRVRDSKRVTLAHCDLRRAQHRGGGGNGYLFELRASSEILTRDCTARHGRHNFIQNWGFGLSGCVWLRIHSADGKALLGPNSGIGTLGYSEFHHSLAMANLVDNSVIDDGWASRNRHDWSTGAGQTATNNVIWRLGGSGYVQSYNFGDGYVIGTGPGVTVQSSLSSFTGKDGGTGTAPEDWVEGLGLAAALTPASLYEAQLGLRLGL